MVGWLKKGRADALLAPLAAAINGQVTDGRLKGTYQGYAVEARPKREPPAKSGDDPAWVNPPVNIFELTLAGVGGHHGWKCRSRPSVIPPGGSPGFAFEAPGQGLVGRRVQGLAARVGGAAALPDDAMEQRLVSAGLFEQLSQLRWGRNHFLPKSKFIPPSRETSADFMDSSFFAALEAAVDRSPKLSEQLQAAGQADLRSAMAASFQTDEAQNPGKLTCEVEIRDDTIPTLERFRELLDCAVRIAEINAQANPPQKPGDRVEELGP